MEAVTGVPGLFPEGSHLSLQVSIDHHPRREQACLPWNFTNLLRQKSSFSHPGGPDTVSLFQFSSHHLSKLPGRNEENQELPGGPSLPTSLPFNHFPPSCSFLASLTIKAVCWLISRTFSLVTRLSWGGTPHASVLTCCPHDNPQCTAPRP